MVEFLIVLVALGFPAWEARELIERTQKRRGR